MSFFRKIGKKLFFCAAAVKVKDPRIELAVLHRQFLHETSQKFGIAFAAGIQRKDLADIEPENHAGLCGLNGIEGVGMGRRITCEQDSSRFETVEFTASFPEVLLEKNRLSLKQHPGPAYLSSGRVNDLIFCVMLELAVEFFKQGREIFPGYFAEQNRLVYR